LSKAFKEMPEGIVSIEYIDDFLKQYSR
jgi:hypothetical protein